MRLCAVDTKEGSNGHILQVFLFYIVAASSLRLLGWIFCTAFYFEAGQSYIKYSTYEQI